MDDAARVRDASRSALADVEPPPLCEALAERLADASMTPGVLTLLSARALEPDVDLEGVAERAAGVQLIYEGLRLTRTLAHDEPWAADPDSAAVADIQVLAADVLVARGFYLLARTEAAERAVEVVRAFGADQTRRREALGGAAGGEASELVDADGGIGEHGSAEAVDRNLEADVFTLGVVAGATAVGGETPASLLEYAAELARGYQGDMPPAAVALPDTAGERIASLSGDARARSASDH